MQQSCQKSPSGDLGVEELRFKFNTMRQYPLFFILIGLSCILSSSSCDKEDKTKNCCNCTAPETQTGAGTLSFELNGKVWSPCGDGDNKVYASSYLNNGVPKIKIYKTRKLKKGNDDFIIEIYYPEIGELKYAQVSDLKNRFTFDLYLFSEQYSDITPNIYYTDTLKPYLMEITKYDKLNKVISGRFYCEMNSYDDKDTIRITNGRFDAPIIP
jgi:hypothetical protein